MNQATPRSWKRPPFIESSLLRWGLITGGVLFLVVSIGTMEVNWERVAAGLPRAERFLASFFPPDFTSKSSDIWAGIVESLWMTVVSTVIGILLSIPVGLGAARNLSPRYVYLVSRGILALSRTFPEIIIALFAVKLFGFGPFAGIIALSIGSIGFYGKLLAEDIEDMDPV